MTASESRTATFRPGVLKSSRSSAATLSSGRNRPSARWAGILTFARSSSWACSIGRTSIEKTNAKWAENARAYHRHASRNDLCLTHGLTDQYYDRTKRVSEQEDPDLILHIVGETQDGAVVRGLRTLATLAPLSDEVLIYPNRARDADEADYAIAFALPMNAPGLKIVCRDLYAEHADPERHPLTTRFDEVDAALIFDDVVVPWNRIFVYKDPEAPRRHHVHSHLGAVLDDVTSDYKTRRFFGHRPAVDPVGEAQHERIRRKYSCRV